ncbi:MAG: PASTA domain-containing protein [Clostridium sp.]|nr:PASTA domain-containing protein [Clostridium sp.]
MAKGTTVKMWRRTLIVLIVMVALGFGLIVVSLIRLQLVDGAELQKAAVDQQLRDTTISAQRGTIYDRNMKPLAQSATVWKVVMAPAYIDKEDETLRRKISTGVADILELDAEDVYKRTEGTSYYDVLKTKVETDVKDRLVQFIEENDLGNTIQLQEDYKRYYPFGSFASTILGFTGTDGQGLAGLEAYYDEYLSGTAGRLVTAKNAVGTDMPFQYQQKVEAQDGYNLVLTIDEVVQHYLEQALAEGVENNKVENRATGIVMNVKTGEIVAMAVKGDYDPNNPFVIADEQERARIAELPEEEQQAATSAALQAQWRNKAVSDTYYPGSVFKMVTLAMALEENVASEETTFTCTGSYVPVPGERAINCHVLSGHGTETLVRGTMNSCNPFFIYLGQLLGTETFFDYFEAFGFTQKTGIDLPGEASTKGLYHDRDMSLMDLAVESFGQNFSITPIQMITACAAIANGGYLVQPHVVSQIVDNDGNIIKTADTNVKRQVISEETSARVSKILQENATSGTAKNGYVAGYRIAGKTGTSEKVGADGKVGSDNKYIASYCGFAPADDPQYAVLVFFDEPTGDSYYGGAVAGPVFAKIMEEILPYLNVETKYTEDEAGSVGVSTPNVIGKTVSEATNELSNNGLKILVKGSGDTVIAQTPDPGSSVPSGGTVVVYTDEASMNQTVTVPDFTNRSLSDVNYLAAQAGLNIKVTGAYNSSVATARTQDYAVGEQIKPGTVITVNFVEKDAVR